MASVRARSDVLGMLSVIHAWAVIGLAMAVYALWPNPLTFLAAVIMTIAAALPASADPLVGDGLGRRYFRSSCSSYSSCQPSYYQPYCQPSYYQPYCEPPPPQPYCEPPPYYPVQKVLAQEIAVAPLIVTVPVESKAVPVHAFGSPYYYSVSQAYQEKAYIRDVFREELRSLMNGSTTQGTTNGGYARQTVTPATNAQAVNQQPQGQPAPFTQRLVADTSTPVELLAAYGGRANCLSCHGATGPAQGPKGADGKVHEFRLAVDDGKGGTALAYQPNDKRWKIYGLANVRAMPPAAVTDAAKAMESEHMQTLLQYAAIKDQ